jgi:hypothetical protein
MRGTRGLMRGVLSNPEMSLGTLSRCRDPGDANEPAGSVGKDRMGVSATACLDSVNHPVLGSRVIISCTKRFRTVAAAVGIALAATACGGADVSPTTPEEMWALAAAAQERPLQSPAFDDGVVTFPEYESAILAVVRCIRDAGYVVIGPNLDDAGRFLVYDYGGVETPQELDVADEIQQVCLDRHASYIIEAYALSTATPQQEIDRRWAAYRSCVEGAGFDYAEFEDRLAHPQLMTDEMWTIDAECAQVSGLS